MYCERCGFFNEESVNFCQRCGAPLNGEKAAPQGRPQQANRPIQQSAMVPGNGRDALKARAGSGLFLATAILLTAQCVFQIIGNFLSANQLLFAVQRMLRMSGVLDIPGEIFYVLNNGSAAIGASVLIGSIPAILMVVGVWMIYAAGKSKQPGTMGTAGLTMHKVILIIQMVCVILLISLAEILLVLALVQADGFGSIQGVIIGLMIAFVLIFVLILLYYVKAINMLSAAKRIALTEQAEECGSIYVAILCFVGAFSVLISGFFAGVWGILGGVCGCAANVLFGIIIFGVRADMTNCVAGTYRKKIPVMAGAAPAMGGTQFAAASTDNKAAAPFAAPNQVPETNCAVSTPMDTVLLSTFSNQETTVLSQSPVAQQNAAQPTAWLTRVKDGNVIQINKPLFKLGKDLGNVDFFIGDNTAVSRHHADIVYRDGCYYVRDNNSTNHVYLNELQIPADVEVALENHARILLADDAYEFSMQ